MFSKACEYAIRAMMYIVTKTRDGCKVRIKAIRDNILSMLKTNTVQDLASSLVNGDTFLLKK